MDNKGPTFWGLCKGTTKAGLPCKRTVVYANGYCRAHGGDSSEYVVQNNKRLADKMERRLKRWRRKLERIGA